ncbi:unnamed protein product [Angiostrongylus costaricensis]|uniref:SH2 domain-containing protein n=1 Tax=Angiostrongylus costaricensis TaxID=334426 RepID=A0A158PE85_ANGCS|nr:unnamed protein product [Angiostrongylus costaricensis]
MMRKIEQSLTFLWPLIFQSVVPLDRLHSDASLIKHECFHGLLPREDTVSLLTKDGDFLLRLSEADTMGARLETILSVLHDPKSCVTVGDDPETRAPYVLCSNLIILEKKVIRSVAYSGFNSILDVISHYLKHIMVFKSQKIQLRRPVGLASWEFHAENIELKEVICVLVVGEVRKGKVYSKDDAPLTVVVKTIIIYEIFARKEPYDGLINDEAKSFILEGDVNDFPGTTPKVLAEMVRKCEIELQTFCLRDRRSATGQ